MSGVKPSDEIVRQITAELDGDQVRLTLSCVDHYGAIKFYEEVVGALRTGGLVLNLQSRKQS